MGEKGLAVPLAEGQEPWNRTDVEREGSIDLLAQGSHAAQRKQARGWRLASSCS